MTTNRRLRVDAIWAGALTGAGYGIGETFFNAVLTPAFARLAADDYAPLAPVTTLVFLLVYPILGAVLGWLLALVARAIPGLRKAGHTKHSFELLGLLTFGIVLLLVGANVLAAGHNGKSAALSLGLPALLLGGGLIRCVYPRVRAVSSALAPLFSPGYLTWLLTGLLWVTLVHYLYDSAGLADKARGAGAIVVVGAALAFLGARLQRSGGVAGRRGHVTRVALAAALVWLSALVVEYPPAPGIPAATQRETRGNGTPVVVIVLDTLRADHLDLYGYERETAPNLRRFAQTATRYDYATTSASYTLTGHASLFTGLFPSHNGSDTGFLPGDNTTLAEHLGEAGYDTWAVVANNAFLGKGYGLDQGFDFIDARPGRAPFRQPSRVFLRQPISTFVRESFLRHLNTYDWRSASEINLAARPVLDEITRRDRPFFLLLNYMDVHRPITLSAEWRDRFPGRDPEFDWSVEWHELQEAVETRGAEVSERQKENLLSQYDGAIAYLDSQIGLIFDVLRERDLFDRSLIVVTSDHGEAFGEHSTFGHGRSVYQGVARAVLLIKYPQQTRPEVDANPTGVVDVLPTALVALELPTPTGLDGVDLASEAARQPRFLMAEAFKDQGSPVRALYSGYDKLIVRPDGRRELYALADDPNEERDRSTTHLDVLSRLEAALAETMERNAYRPTNALEGISERDKERLRALGYIIR